MSAINADSEMEEGEIVDDVDDLSDISSEEEFLLRQRLEVLESYNNVLERKKAKSSTKFNVKGTQHKKVHTSLQDLSEISTTDLEDNYCSPKRLRHGKHVKLHYKQRRKNSELKNTKSKDFKKKHHNKKRAVLVIPETSDESEDEYRNKRIKLANAVNVNRNKIDKSSLSVRLKKMICDSVNQQPVETFNTNDKQAVFENNNRLQDPMFSPITSITVDDSILSSEQQDKIPSKEVIKKFTNFSEFIDLCTDDHIKIDDHNQQNINNLSLIDIHKHTQSVINREENTVDSIVQREIENLNIMKSSDKDSDEDLEMLRQNVLKTKVVKTKVDQDDLPIINYSKNLSDDEDSDTAELRLICLRSALLKKAIEIKQKQKLQKRLSQSSIIQDDILDDPNIFSSKIESKNNTDTESVDMDIGSDEDGKVNEGQNAFATENNSDQNAVLDEQQNFNDKRYLSKVDELDEDEDLLRAKLLTSLSKNLPNLISPTVIETVENISPNKIKQPTNLSKNAAEEKKFIIKLGESDSEGEHEATKNLTKMHMKLSEELDFQQKLDIFLKSTRMEVENSKQPVVIQEQLAPKKTEKFVAKAVNSLPKSEQIEYKNLVKRMAELEKIKQSRQSSMGIVNRPVPVKETLKPHNMSNDSTTINLILEGHISVSRKKIAEESSKMLKLKEEAKKLSQKYKIVATELRNITTAIALNKKQQRSVQNCLTKIRLHHQTLLKRSSTSRHSKINGQVPSLNQLRSKMLSITKLQKENDPSKEECKNTQALRTVKVSVLHDKKEETNTNPILSIQVNFATNNNVDKKPKSPVSHEVVDSNHNKSIITEKRKDNADEGVINAYIKDSNKDFIKKYVDNHKEIAISNYRNNKYGSLDDYKSPLQSLGATNWEADPNAILCPFEVFGECKDSDCKYLHAKIKTTQ